MVKLLSYQSEAYGLGRLLWYFENKDESRRYSLRLSDLLRNIRDYVNVLRNDIFTYCIYHQSQVVRVLNSHRYSTFCDNGLSIYEFTQLY